MVLKAAFENETDFLQHTRRRRIVRERLGINSTERKIVETKIGESRDRLSHDAASPELLAKPVTQSRGVSIHVLPDANTNSTRSYALNLGANFVAGCSLIARCKNSCASWMAYGWGNRSRSAIQTFRLFACFASDPASSSRHGRIVHRSKTSCIDYLASNLMPAFWTSP